MEWVIALVLLALLGYLIYEELLPVPAPLKPRLGLGDYYVAGTVYGNVRTAIKDGFRLAEVHIYADEQDRPIVATKPMNSGYDFADANVPFEQVCIDIVNDAFPSNDPFILSIVPHTDKSVTLNRVAECILTTLRRNLTPVKDEITRYSLDALANKVILVSGGSIRGTQLEDLINLSWDGSELRRLTYQQALFPRDPEELTKFNREFITLVAPQPELKTLNENPKKPFVYGCQWNLFMEGPPGFVEKPRHLR